MFLFCSKSGRFKKIFRNKTVYLADRNKAFANVDCKISCKGNNILIKNALYVSQLDVSEGFEVKCTTHGCSISENNKSYAKAPLKDNLFVLDHCIKAEKLSECIGDCILSKVKYK